MSRIRCVFVLVMLLIEKYFLYQVFGFEFVVLQCNTLTWHGWLKTIYFRICIDIRYAYYACEILWLKPTQQIIFFSHLFTVNALSWINEKKWQKEEEEEGKNCVWTHSSYIELNRIESSCDRLRWKNSDYEAFCYQIVLNAMPYTLFS